MPRDASELGRRLAREAEAVCRHYLASGRREGRYWLVGDVRNTPGRSMFVRLKGPESGRGAAGKWTDAATGEHGDLLDVIRESCGLVDFHDVAERGPPLPELAPLQPGARIECLSAAVRKPDRRKRHDASLACRSRFSADSRRDVFAQSRHYGFARSRQPALPPALLLSAR